MLLVGVVARLAGVRLVVNREVGVNGRIKDHLGLGVLQGLVDALAAELAGDVDRRASACFGKTHATVVGHHVGPADRRMDRAGGILARGFVITDAEHAALLRKEFAPVHRINRAPLADGGAAIVESGVVVGDLVDDVARAVAGGVFRAGDARGHGLRGAVVLVLRQSRVKRLYHAHGDLLAVQIAAGHSGRRAIAEDEHRPDRLGDGACSGLGEPGARGVGLVHLGRVLSGEGLTEEGPAIGGGGVEIHRARFTGRFDITVVGGGSCGEGRRGAKEGVVRLIARSGAQIVPLIVFHEGNRLNVRWESRRHLHVVGLAGVFVLPIKLINSGLERIPFFTDDVPLPGVTLAIGPAGTILGDIRSGHGGLAVGGDRDEHSVIRQVGRQLGVNDIPAGEIQPFADRQLGAERGGLVGERHAAGRGNRRNRIGLGGLARVTCIEQAAKVDVGEIVHRLADFADSVAPVRTAVDRAHLKLLALGEPEIQHR